MGRIIAGTWWLVVIIIYASYTGEQSHSLIECTWYIDSTLYWMYDIEYPFFVNDKFWFTI